ncbi:hypothetical protein DPMN_168109 [Dreissena polymorpha]|uniref:Uncharacterized protein n=1 Tax=Dreissena polymorpha TaxID=45954 RepID=A0A9D4IZC5_DREPO|nr:hypothetical protein DPMN_168109 [Dreissena polymorpha]
MNGYFSVYVLENPSPNTSPHSFVSDGVSVYRVKYGVLLTVLSFALHFNRL